MNYEIDKVYNRDISPNAFGLPYETIIRTMKDGRYAAPFMEEKLCEWFFELVHVFGNKGHDFYHVDDPNIILDHKNFTKGGGAFSPSNQTGAGRKFNEKIAHAKAKNLIYIFTDINDFPHIQIIFKYGKDLIIKYPKCRIPFKDRETFFSGQGLVINNEYES